MTRFEFVKETNWVICSNPQSENYGIRAFRDRHVVTETQAQTSGKNINQRYNHNDV